MWTGMHWKWHSDNLLSFLNQNPPNSKYVVFCNYTSSLKTLSNIISRSLPGITFTGALQTHTETNACNQSIDNAMPDHPGHNKFVSQLITAGYL